MKTFSKFFIAFIIVISGCSSESQLIKTYEILFEPVKEQNIISYYVSGLPLGASSVNNFNIIFNLQPTQILGEDYLRLWFFIENNSEQEILFEPTQEFNLVLKKKNLKLEAKPESPLVILKNIEDDKQVSLITQTIASALKSVSTTNTTITNKDNNEQIEINDADEKREKIDSKNNQKINNIGNWYDLYSESFNQGVLRKNTLFPKKSTNGYIYFKFDQDITEDKTKDWGRTKTTYKVSHKIEFAELKDYEIYLECQKILIGSKIKFIQVKGE